MYLTQHTDYGLRVLVYTAIKMQVVECMGDNNECLITPSCRLTGIITGAIKAFFNHLDQYSLRDLLDKPTYDILYTPRIPINEIRRMVD